MIDMRRERLNGAKNIIFFTPTKVWVFNPERAIVEVDHSGLSSKTMRGHIIFLGDKEAGEKREANRDRVERGKHKSMVKG